MKSLFRASLVGLVAVSALALTACSGAGGSSSSASGSASPSASTAAVCTSLGSKLSSTLKGLELVSSSSTGATDFTCEWHDAKQSDPLKQKSLLVSTTPSTDGSVDKSFLEGNSAVSIIPDTHVDGLSGVVYSVADSTDSPNRVVSVDTPKTNTTITVRNFGASGFDDAVATRVVDAAVTK
ncbi:hypothetical protein [Frondihabitans cladoniiphilus]|uniref:DUF3558 domain-containing protein n=1 Tax=Frondihabitans cladoniiphilus TaxID=715785 RepID=A0ABP8WAG6_9MICO